MEFINARSTTFLIFFLASILPICSAQHFISTYGDPGEFQEGDEEITLIHFVAGRIIVMRFSSQSNTIAHGIFKHNRAVILKFLVYLEQRKRNTLQNNIYL